METKKDIRKRILNRRRELPSEQWRGFSREIAKKVTEHPLFQKADHVYCYLSFRNEVDTTLIIQEAWDQGKKVAVPKVLSETEMQFYYIDSFADLEPGTYGILEPKTEEAAEDTSALVILPGAVFDQACNRIGYGGGYYDRYLERHPAYDTMALAFSLQLVPDIPADAHDICPEYLITETECFWRKN